MLSVNERWLEILLTPMRDQITVAETCRRYGCDYFQAITDVPFEDLILKWLRTGGLVR